MHYGDEMARAAHQRAARATRGRNRIEKADVHASAALAPIRDLPVTRVASALSECADQPPLVALSGGVLAAGAVLRNRRLARTGFRMLAAHALATAVKTVIKNNVDRSRPRGLIDDGEYELCRGQSHDSELRSFPSGHSAGAVAVARAAGREYPATMVPGGIAAGALTLALIPKQAHYPTDVVAGVAIGWLSELAVDRLFDLVAKSLPKRRAAS